jgi:hypothetical protein
MMRTWMLAEVVGMIVLAMLIAVIVKACGMG